MEQEKIYEGNKLIHKFMESMAGKGEVYASLVGRRSYHDDWNSLIPVVDKIGQDFDVRITWTADGMQVTYIDRPEIMDDDSIADYGGYEPIILNTWLTVVKFIEWYNQKNKKQ